MRSSNSTRKISALFAALFIGIGLVGVTSTPALAAAVTDTTSLNAAIALNDPVISISNNFTLDASIDLIDYDVEIQGNGHTITGAAFGGFATDGANITISNLTVVDPAFSAFDITLTAGKTATLTNVSTSSTDYGILADLAGDGATISITGGTHSNSLTDAIIISNSLGDGTINISGVTMTNVVTGIEIELNNNSNASISNSTISDAYDGIELEVHDGSTVDVSKCTITSGPNNNSGVNGYGFSVDSDGGTTVTFDGGLIDGHPGTDSFFSGVYIYQDGPGSISLTNGTIRNSYYGVYISDNYDGAQISLDKMSVSSNTAEGIDGSLHTAGSKLSVSNSTFSENGSVGIILDLYDASQLLVDSSTFSGNVDGAIWAYLYDQASARVINSTISGGLPGPDDGWAVWAGGDYDGQTYFELLHSTVTDNDGAVGVGIEATRALISHSIISGNNIIDPGFGSETGELWISDSEYSDLTVEWSIIGVVVDETAGVGYTEGAGVVTGVTDPGLGPLAANGGPTMTHLLKSTSPALNAGNPAIAGQPTYDQRGLARISGSAIDIGAVEMQPSLADTGTDNLYWMLGAIFLLLLTGSGLLLVRRRLQNA